MAIGQKKQLTMKDRNSTPDVIKLGHAVRLFSVAAGAILFTVDEETMEACLGAMRVPTVTIKEKKFFNVAALEKAVYYALEPGRRGWVFGRKAKNMEDTGYFERACKIYSGLDRRRLEKRVMEAGRMIRVNAKIAQKNLT